MSSLEGSEPVGLASDGVTLIDGKGEPIPSSGIVMGGAPPLPAGNSGGELHLLVGDGTPEGSIRIDVIGGQFVIAAGDGTPVLEMNSDGSFSILDVGGFAQVAVNPGQTAANKNSLAVKNGNGDSIFQIRGDGSLHGKTGKALTFDL